MVKAVVRDDFGSLALQVSVYYIALQVDCVTSGGTSTGPELQYGKVTSNTSIRSLDKTLIEAGQEPTMMQDFRSGNPLSVMVSVRVRGNKVQALLDAGACVNLLTLSFLKVMGHLHLLEPYSGQAGTVDVYFLDLHETIKARTRVGDVDATMEYLVAESFQVPAVLGLMFMTTHKCSLDLHSKQFLTGTESSVITPQLKGNK